MGGALRDGSSDLFGSRSAPLLPGAPFAGKLGGRDDERLCDDRDDVTMEPEEVCGELEVAQAEFGSREYVAQEKLQLQQGSHRQQPPPEGVPEGEQRVSEEIDGGDRDKPVSVTGPLGMGVRPAPSTPSARVAREPSETGCPGWRVGVHGYRPRIEPHSSSCGRESELWVVSCAMTRG